MTKEILSAENIQKAINMKLEEAGLGPTYRVGLPARLVPPALDGHNWHFIDVLTGDVEEITTVTAVLSDARHRYVMADD
ncbi:hypothetical protein [Caballeronia sordidicola]|uniref:Uncharacterized protein n=1 Tax=Caballeronia sordidicola TaxID=196367 RepID=A0A226X5P4_CABSO|nr:hypothetical protein [Caballeronia sordidicola]OXC78751.1 hypothetical protein BSU04_10335 [Caballeronia sordidicola]